MRRRWNGGDRSCSARSKAEQWAAPAVENPGERLRPQIDVALQLQFGDARHAAFFRGDESGQQAANVVDQFRNGNVRPILWPLLYKCADMIYPYAAAMKSLLPPPGKG